MKRAGTAIRLRAARGVCNPSGHGPHYEVLLYGKKVDELVHSPNGYVGSLPTPDGGVIDIGELPIDAFRQQANQLNREFRRLQA